MCDVVWKRENNCAVCLLTGECRRSSLSKRGERMIFFFKFVTVSFESFLIDLYEYI